LTRWSEYPERMLVATAMRNAGLAVVAEEVLAPLDGWANQCHAAALKLVKSGRFGACRVARGGCEGVPGQHSWVVLGDDCYDDHATIIDPTLWSYDETVEGIWVGTYQDGKHVPHGKGSIWNWGRPDTPTGPVVELTPRKPFSREAQGFLDVLGPLDHAGWAMLAHAPVEGWPAAEIIDAIYNTPELTTWVPIDIVGMITDRNPKGLYLP
jgi:hypothetical protein